MKRSAILVMMFLACSATAFGQSSPNYRIEVDVISGGGGNQASTNYHSLSTLGQPSAVGSSSSGSYANYSGYLYAMLMSIVEIPPCDFNGDGMPDIVWRNRSTGALVVWFMDGIDMTSWSYFNPSPVHTDWKTVGAGDFNGDRKPDIVLRNSSTGELVVWFMDGINMTGWSYFNPSPVHTSWKAVGVEDINGDEKPDILWRNSETGEFAVWFMDGINMTSSNYFNPSPIHTSWETVGAGDFNGDGKPDVMWRNRLTGEFAVWFMNGINMTSSNYFNPSPVHTSWETVGAGDFDGDRKPDVLWRNGVTGEFVVWFMNGINMTSWSYFNPSPIDTIWVPMGARWNMH